MGSRILDIMFGPEKPVDPEPPSTQHLTSARCKHGQHVQCAGRAGFGRPGPGTEDCACFCHAPEPEPRLSLEPVTGWRELERARLAANPEIRRVSWECRHGPIGKQIDKRYQHAMPGKGLAWRGPKLMAIPRSPFPHGPF